MLHAMRSKLLMNDFIGLWFYHQKYFAKLRDLFAAYDHACALARVEGQSLLHAATKLRGVESRKPKADSQATEARITLIRTDNVLYGANGHAK